MNKLKLCINCKWHKRFLAHFCTNPNLLNNIDGSIKYTCKAARSGWEEIVCGPNAKFYEEKGERGFRDGLEENKRLLQLAMAENEKLKQEKRQLAEDFHEYKQRMTK